MSIRRSYTCYQLAEAVKHSLSISDVLRWLGRRSWSSSTASNLTARILKYELDVSHFVGQGHARGKVGHSVCKTPEQILVKRTGSRRQKGARLRKALLALGRPYECALCKLGPEWLGRKLELEVDHINGDRLDDTPANLRFLCPNCHAQESKAQTVRRVATSITLQIYEQNQRSVALTSVSLGLSEGTVRNHLRAEGVVLVGNTRLRMSSQNRTEPFTPKTKIQWPSRAELSDRVWDVPVSTIASELGVSDKAVAKHCRRVGISVPPRGYWAKRKSNSCVRGVIAAALPRGGSGRKTVKVQVLSNALRVGEI